MTTTPRTAERKIAGDAFVASVVIVVLSIAAEKWCKQALFGLSFGAFYDTVSGALSTLFGFVLAAAALVVALPPNHLIEKLKEHGHIDDLWTAYTVSMFALGAGTVVAAGAVLVAEVRAVQLYVFWFVAFFVVWGTLAAFRCVTILRDVVRIVVKNHARNVAP